MEFVDYKCLESLIIEGEEIIATEGFIDNLKKRIVDFFKMIGRMIDKLIGIIKAKFSKSPSKKFSSEELKKMGIDTFEPDTIKIDRVEVDRAKIDRAKVDRAKVDRAEPAKKNPSPPSDENTKKNEEAKSKKNATFAVMNMVQSISRLSSLITMTCTTIGLATMSKDEIESLDEKVSNYIEDIDSEIEEFYSNFNKVNNHLDEYYVSGDTQVRDKTLRELEKTKARVDKAINEIDKDVKENKFEGGETLSSSIYSSLTKSMGKVTSIISNTINIINKIEFR